MADTTLVVRCVRGLEWVVADEVAATFPAGRIGLFPREVHVTLPELDSRVFDLRTADDALLVVGDIGEVGHTKSAPPVMAEHVARLSWQSALAALGELRALPPRPQFDVVASLTGRRNYNRYAVEDAVGAVLERTLGMGYRSRAPGDGRSEIGSVDMTVRAFVTAQRATIALRLAPRPLHRRAYKQESGPGTLHPPVAAALVRLAGIQDGETILDPFCGDGTIPVEAALSFPGARVLGGDRDPDRLANARRNADRAEVTVAFHRADAADLPVSPGAADVLITNPPWNLAVDAGGRLSASLRPFWRFAGAVLSPSGRLCAVVDDALAAPSALRDSGYELALAVRIRLAGRLSDVVLGAPRWARPPRLTESLARWRSRARSAGVVGTNDF